MKPHTSLTALHVAWRFIDGTDVPIGRLALDRGCAVLEYDRAFRATGLQVNPLLGAPSDRLVRARTPASFDGLHGVFADSLPDAWGELLLRRGAQARGIAYERLTVLDRLALVGTRGMGALIYRPETGVPYDEESLDLDQAAGAADAVLQGEASDMLALLEAAGGSSGGARPKAFIGIAPDDRIVVGARDASPTYEPWIVKFRGAHDPPEIGPLEAAYADMARAAGLEIAPTRLLPSRRGPGYFATRRFDRAGSKRVHFASAAGLLDTPWSIPTIDYGTLCALTGAITKRRVDVEAVFARAVFNVMAHNRDDHAKQHAYLMDASGTWRAAPSYDLTFSRGPGGEHYLAVAGKGRDITADDLRKLGRDQGLSLAIIRAVLERTAEATAHFADFAARYDIARATVAPIAATLAETTRAASRV